MLGAPTLKLRGDYLAIVTLGFGEIVRLVFRNLGDITIALPAFLGGAVIIGPNANLTGGNVGINPIDPPTIPIPGPWGASDRVLEPERDRVLVPRPRTPGASRSSSAAACATRSWAGHGWPSARTRPRPPRWASTRSRPSCSRSRWARASRASPARSPVPTRPAIFAETFSFNVSILVVDHHHPWWDRVAPRRGHRRLRLLYVDRTLLPWLGDNIVNDPMQQSRGLDRHRSSWPTSS